MQKRFNSSALAMESHVFCIKLRTRKYDFEFYINFHCLYEVSAYC